jgi:hypothetical protein
VVLDYDSDWDRIDRHSVWPSLRRGAIYVLPFFVTCSIAEVQDARWLSKTLLIDGYVQI